MSARLNLLTRSSPCTTTALDSTKYAHPNLKAPLLLITCQYRTDPDLSASHQNFPWINVWDDHGKQIGRS